MKNSQPAPRPIALFFSNLRGGGIQRVMLNLAEGFLQAGQRVDLVIVQAEGELAPEISDGVRLINLNKRRALFALKTLIDYLEREKPIAVLASQPHLNILAIIARRAARVDTRVVISEHIAFEDAARNSTRFVDRWSALLGRLFYKRADGIIAVSQGVKDQVVHAARIAPGRVQVIHNPILSASFDQKIMQSAQHRWLGQNIPLILSAGRLTAQKDFATLLRAFAILRKSQPARLIILGEGEERNSLLKLAAELKIDAHVDLPGFMPNPFGFMQKAHLFVLSSRWEGFGNVLVEALACGLPVVATNCPSGPAEILEHGKYGTLTPVGDAPALAAAMLQTLKQPPSAEMLKRRAQDFSNATIVPRYLQTLLDASDSIRAGSGL